MSTTVAGNPANWATSITVPSDGDGPSIKAADVAVGFEALADRTANLDARTKLAKYVCVLAAPSGQQTITSTAFVDLTGATTAAMALKAGDLVMLDLTIEEVDVESAGHSPTDALPGLAILNITANNGADAVVLGSQVLYSSNANLTRKQGSISAACVYPAPADGNYTFRARARVGASGDTLYALGRITVRALAVRP